MSMVKNKFVVFLIVSIFICGCQKNESWRYSREPFKDEVNTSIINFTKSITFEMNTQ